MENRIEFERTLAPPDIHNRYRVLDGAIDGRPSHGKFRDAFKPGNRSNDVHGLHRAGATAGRGPKRRRRHSWRLDWKIQFFATR